MVDASSFWFANPGGDFYNGVATQSVRFNQPSSSYLSKAVDTGTTTTSTFAWWMKRGQPHIGASNIGEIFCFGGSGGGGTQSSARITLEANKLHVSQEDNNSTTWDLQTTQLFRDHSSWYHCVVVIDTTQGTDADKVKVYINGNKITSFSTASYPSQNLSTRFGLNGTNLIGVGVASGNPWSASYFDGYFADMYYLDGQAVAPEAFGEDKDGVWIPKKYDTKPSLIAQDTGSAIGDMTGQGGLAGAFNGTRFQAYSASAAQTGSQATSYIGKNWSGSSKTVTGFILYSNTQFGFVGSGASTFTVKLYGKDGSPSNSTDGTLLFTSSAVTDANSRGAIRYFADTNIQSEETISNFTTTTAFTYHWVVITPNASEGAFVSEIEFYEDGSTNYGTNGFRLEFNQTGTGTGASDTIGADSGNTNHYTSSGIDADGCNMPDSPENNFCTMNPIANGRGNASSFSEGNLKIASTSGAFSFNTSTFRVSSGKWYFEMMANDTNAKHCIGISGHESINTTSALGDGSAEEYSYTAIGQIRATSAASGLTTYGNQDIIGVAMNLEDNELQFFLNGSSITTISITAPSGTTDGGYGPAYGDFAGDNTGTATLNCGQDPSFAGVLHSGGTAVGTETPDTGAGVFKYDPPSGFLALCSANISDDNIPISPAQTTQATDHFNTLLYTGDGNDDRTVGASAGTGLAFKPDWAIFKGRDDSHPMIYFDSTRGDSQQLRSDGTGASNTGQGQESSQSGKHKTFVAPTDTPPTNGGYTVGTDTSVNENTKRYVVWSWKANGGVTTSHSAGDNSATEASVSQADTTSGFSIVTYTGDTSGHGSAYPSTFNHGLGKTPRMIIVKARTATQDWAVYHENLNTGSSYNHFLSLNINGTRNSANNAHWGGNTMTLNDNLFSAGSSNLTGANGVNYVAYLFADVDGFSKSGSYTGNGVDDGTFVYLGFKPAWLLIKSIAHSESWHLWDNKRVLNGNPNQAILSPDTKGADTGASTPYDIDFLSNGFKIRDDHDLNNGSGDTHIYMAFAEAPFKYANAR